MCGEYYVCAQMHLKGWTASMTLKNYPGIDILGYNPTENKRTEIQVKTGQRFTAKHWSDVEYVDHVLGNTSFKFFYQI